MEVNPTGLLMARIAGGLPLPPRADVEALELDTSYRRAGEQLEAALARFQPDALLSLGVAVGERVYRIERLAVNLNDSASPDADADLRIAQVIVEEGPVEYGATLPLAALEKALRKAGITVRISDSAGRYVCNHIFYSALHALTQTQSLCRAGFLHVPDPGAGNDWQIGEYMATLETVVRISVEVLCADLDAAKLSPGSSPPEAAHTL
jgi:pyroglutamyl-peptidase